MEFTAEFRFEHMEACYTRRTWYGLVYAWLRLCPATRVLNQYDMSRLMNEMKHSYIVVCMTLVPRTLN